MRNTKNMVTFVINASIQQPFITPLKNKKEYEKQNLKKKEI